MKWFSKFFHKKSRTAGQQIGGQIKQALIDVDPSDLEVDPIPSNRMDLLWMDDQGLEVLEIAVKAKQEFVLGPECGGFREPKKLTASEHDVKWAKEVDKIAAKAAAASSCKDFISAIKSYREALKKAPGADIYLMSIGCCFANIGYPEKGLLYLERAHEIGPDRPRITRNLEGIRQQLRETS